MTSRRIVKVSFTTEGGQEHTVEGPGVATLVTTYSKGEGGAKIPIGRLEVLMGLPAEYRMGDGDVGKYVATPTLRI